MGNGQSSSSSQPADGRAGYVDPEEQARRDRQDKQFGEAMNSNGVRVYQQRAAEDAKVNAAAAGGGFNMDVAAMKALLPEWQGVADKLFKARQLARALPTLRKPADDSASTLQKTAADQHASAYSASLEQQYTYAKSYADKLKEAVDKYEKQDHANTDGMNRQG
ncbi:hypothetical protein [Amycolatopsis rubida]|uniref:PE domain-containing protein n=1 Tax=Amycolatopsis rubida TaxID=112413 RepID=A0A1I5CYG7_9PSEU|nr:hypothetical protein [Amycolatopsis rubida]SFN91963.1 hypothetical protein SAMN05421854_10131 [Amycolatopsis rubida]